jgi:hypothetical protein
MINSQDVLEAYIEREKTLHARKIDTVGSEAMRKYGTNYNKWTKRTRNLWLELTDEKVKIHDSLLETYPIDFNSFFDSNITMKYQIRGYNCLRELFRISRFCPELLDPETNYDVLELSAGSCANHEVLSLYNNTVTLADYFDGRGSAYTPIYEWLGIEPIDFDGSRMPYGMADDSYDYVLCNQALNAYGKPALWPAYIREMVRIARQKVVLVFNSYPRHREAHTDFARELWRIYPDVKTATCPDTKLPAVIIPVNK